MEIIAPIPIPAIPEYAVAPARAKLRDRLAEDGVPIAAADLIANSVVDPAQVRRELEHLTRKRLPVGNVYLGSTEVWSPAVLPSLTNPRPGVDRSWPAGGPTTPPLEQPTASGVEPVLHLDAPGGLQQVTDVDVANRKHLLAKNGTWKASIEQLGVLEPIWAVPTVITLHEAGVAPVEKWVLTSVEGSTRTALAQSLLGHLGGFNSTAEILSRNPNALRLFAKWCNGNGSKATAAWGSADDLHRRVATLPALIPVRFEPRDNDCANFAVAMSSLVATAHMETPTPWEQGAELGELGSAILAELARLQLILPETEAWLAGLLTPEEALAQGFSGRITDRAAKLYALFTGENPGVHEVIRRTVTAHTTRRKVDRDYKAKIAAELIARSFADEDHRDRARKRTYLAKGPSKTVLFSDFSADHTVSTNEIAERALRELAASETSGRALGELAARAWVAAVDSEALYGHRGFGEVAADYREAGEVVDTMVKSPHGVRQLARIIEDHAAIRQPVMVDTAGAVVLTDDRTAPVAVNNTELRRRFNDTASGFGITGDQSDSPDARLGAAMADVFNAVNDLTVAIKAAEDVRNEHGDCFVVDDGYPEVKTRPLAQSLEEIRRKLERWGTTNTIRHGAFLDPGVDVPVANAAAAGNGDGS